MHTASSVAGTKSYGNRAGIASDVLPGGTGSEPVNPVSLRGHAIGLRVHPEARTRSRSCAPRVRAWTERGSCDSGHGNPRSAHRTCGRAGPPCGMPHTPWRSVQFAAVPASPRSSVHGQSAWPCMARFRPTARSVVRRSVPHAPGASAARPGLLRPGAAWSGAPGEIRTHDPSFPKGGHRRWTAQEIGLCRPGLIPHGHWHGQTVCLPVPV